MGTKKKVIAYLSVLGLTVAAIAAPQDGRKLVWSDEFGGSSLDATKWKFHATMNSDDCVYTNDSRTARVEDGCLHLLVVPSGDPAKPQMLPRGVSTRDKMAFRYGYLEMRARVPFRHGAWPSFWMTVQPGLRKAAWGSEVDIFEVFSSTNAVVANLHKWAGQKGHFMLPGGEGSLKRRRRQPQARVFLQGLLQAERRVPRVWLRVDSEGDVVLRGRRKVRDFPD